MIQYKFYRLLTLTFKALAIYLFAVQALPAQEVQFHFDPAASRVEFTLGDILHTVHGSFRLKSGIVEFDKSTGNARGQIIVDATSGDSGSEGRDKRMHKDILESQKYQEITFVPQRVHGQIVESKESALQIDGLLYLHGSQHPITIAARVNPKGDQLTAQSQFDVPYVSWGLKNPSTFILRVSTTVNIAVYGSGHLTESPIR